MKRVIKYPLLTIGAALMGLAVKMIFDTSGLVTGGVSGIAVILQNVLNIPMWFTNVAINIPLFIYGFHTLERKVLWDSFYANLIFTLAIGFFPDINPVGDDIFLSAVAGGFIMGTGMGIILSCDATSGGADLAAYMIQKKSKRIKTVWIIFIIDAVIIAFGTPVFGIPSSIYGVISVFTISFVSGKIVDGPSVSRTAYIISRNSVEIATIINERLERGVTGIKVMGMYENKEKIMLVCVVRKREIHKIMEIVEETDKKAFMWIGDAREVLGEGFVNIA